MTQEAGRVEGKGRGMGSRERKRKVDRLAFLGTLAGGLAHEVKNPLSTMSVNLQLMKEDWENPRTPKEARTLKRVEILMQEIRRLEAVVNDFLNFARGFSLHPELTDLNGLLRELVEFMNPEALRHGVRISTFLDPAAPKVWVDRKYVQKAFMNLFTNAVQALQAVEEDRREILVRTARREDGVEAAVTDTGPGIEPALREKIFQVFYSTRKDGTGMGLPVVRRIVEEHGGTLTLQSEVGKGTSFGLFFPAGEPPEEGEGAADAP